eukprot:jgi/Ulvmu1/2247/UM013_0094.1
MGLSHQIHSHLSGTQGRAQFDRHCLTQFERLLRRRILRSIQSLSCLQAIMKDLQNLVRFPGTTKTKHRDAVQRLGFSPVPWTLARSCSLAVGLLGLGQLWLRVD